MRRLSIGMLLASLVLMSGCTGMNEAGSIPTTPTPVSHVVTVDVAEINGPFSFYPNPATVGSDQTVVWRNSDAVTHRVVFDQGSVDTGNLPSGTASQPMAIGAGTWSYHCSIHPEMVGTLNVTAP
jgi:plastocyanin